MKPKKKSPSTRLRWDVDYDDNGNTILEAVGGSTDGESSDLYYRLEQELRDDAMAWVEHSSPELMMCEGTPIWWSTRNAAKRAMEKWHRGMLASYTEASK